MLVLGLDTSTSVLSVALAEVSLAEDSTDCRVLEHRDVDAPNRHGELLAVLVDDVFRAARADRDDVVAVATGLGPGPFTGLRVGVVSAASLADALGVPAYGVCSLDLVAAAHTHSAGGGGFLVLTDARRKQVYWASYDEAGSRMLGPDLATPAALAERFAGRVSRVCGAGALLYRHELAAFEVDERAPYPSAVALVRSVAPRAVRREAGDALEPLYLRRPDATPPGARKPVTPR